MKLSRMFAVVFLLAAALALPLSLVIALLSGEMLIGLAFFIGVLGSFLLQGLRNIPNDPPHKAVVTKFGKRQQKTVIICDEKGEEKRREEHTVTVDEGWNFFPLCPYWYGYVLVEVKRVPTDVAVEVKTPDRASSKVPIALTFRPLSKFLIEYLNNGGKEGVLQQLSGKIEERVREWAMSWEEGPATWVELIGSRLEAVSVLTKTIGADGITEIPGYAQDVPTFIWMRFFTKPQPKLTELTPENEKEWMKNEWALVKVTYDPLEKSQQEKLKKAVDDRREEVRALRAGSGSIVIQDLGIAVERLNVEDIRPLGRVAEVADTQAKEEQERRGEKLELEHVRDRIAELTKDPFNYTPEQALEIVQTERGKVKKEISETKLNISPETRGLVKDLISPLVETFSHRKGGNS